MFAPESTIATRFSRKVELPGQHGGHANGACAFRNQLFVRDDAGDGVAQLRFADEGNLVDLAPDDVEGERVGVEVAGQPVGERRLHVDRDDPACRDAARERARGLDLDAEDACLLRDASNGECDPRDQPATADRHHDGVDVWPLVEDLESDRAGAGNHVGMAVRRDEERALRVPACSLARRSASS